MSIPLHWIETLRVRSFEVGSDGLLTLPALGGYLQEAASCHAQALGIAFPEVNHRPVFWALHQLWLQVHRRPAWAETVQVETWPCGTRGLRAFRAYTVRDETGSLLAEGLSTWLLVDPERRRPVRLPPAVLRLREMTADAPPPEPSFPEKPPAPPAWVDTVRVRFSDLDRNGHANNTRYLAWLIDVQPEPQRHAPLHQLAITFRHEARLDDTIAVASWPLKAGQLFHQFVRAPDRQVLAEAVTVWAASDQ